MGVVLLFLVVDEVVIVRLFIYCFFLDRCGEDESDYDDGGFLDVEIVWVVFFFFCKNFGGNVWYIVVNVWVVELCFVVYVDVILIVSFLKVWVCFIEDF